MGNPPRFAWATPFGLHPASVLARLAAGAGVAGFALRPSPLPLGSLASTSIKGAAAPAILTRSVLALRAALRVRPPVSPLTLLPANTRATTDDERGHETAKTRRPLVTAARWPGREDVTNFSLDVPPIKAGTNGTTDFLRVRVDDRAEPFD